MLPHAIRYPPVNQATVTKKDPKQLHSPKQGFPISGIANIVDVCVCVLRTGTEEPWGKEYSVHLKEGIPNLSKPVNPALQSWAS